MTQNNTKTPQLVDRLGRIHTDMRISVTDKCNLRCTYCMPEDPVFLDRSEVLSFEEMVRFVRIVAGLGVKTLRLTGGEPLLRRDLAGLISMLKAVPGIEEVSLTTNGLLLVDQAADLKAAGLDRINISIDTLDEAQFKTIAKRSGLEKVLAGIQKAGEVGFENIKLNAVALARFSEDQVVPLARFARDHGLQLRFIEYMPLDGDGQWQENQVLSGKDIRVMLTQAFGPLTLHQNTQAHQPSKDFAYADGKGSVGFINPVSEPFCQFCNRIRITAEGKLRNCLFGKEEWDVRSLLRGTAEDHEIEAMVNKAVLAKKKGQGSDDAGFHRPDRAMFQIGG